MTCIGLVNERRGSDPNVSSPHIYEAFWIDIRSWYLEVGGRVEDVCVCSSISPFLKNQNFSNSNSTIDETPLCACASPNLLESYRLFIYLFFHFFNDILFCLFIYSRFKTSVSWCALFSCLDISQDATEFWVSSSLTLFNFNCNFRKSVLFIIKNSWPTNRFYYPVSVYW